MSESIQISESIWRQTYTGKRFHLLDPQPDEIDIIDIAHGLANICRFCGQTRRFYSVAQHSFLVSWQVPDDLMLTALLHDAAEAYIGDMGRPLKYYTPAGPPFIEIEQRIERVIAAKFGTEYPFPPEIKHADHQMLYAEKEQLMSSSNEDGWSKTTGELGEPARLDIVICPQDPEWAEKIFLNRYRSLVAPHQQAHV